MKPGRIVAPVLPATGLLLLGRMGGGGLDVPLGSVVAFVDWVGTSAPVPLAMALVRLAAQVICGYLLLATALQVLAEALGYRCLHVLATGALPAVLRRTLTGGAGLSLAAGSILWTSGSPAGASGRPAVELLVADEEPSAPAAATMTLLEPPPPGATATMRLLEPTPSKATATMRLLEPSPEVTPVVVPEPTPVAGRPPVTTSGTMPTPDPPAAPPSRLASTSELSPATAVPASAPSDDEIWVVESGDSFWSIAEDMVGVGASTDAYWHRLIAANRDRLAVSDQPDLLFPGQVLTLPRPTPQEG